MKIGNVDLENEILIVAEIGNNHEGDLGLAKTMIAAAAQAGAQAVKFQTIVSGKLVSVKQKETLEMFRKFEFTPEQFAELKEYSDNQGIMFMSTPFDVESVKFLDPLVPAFKISSGDNNYWKLMERVAGTGKPIIISTGMADFESIRKAKEFIENCWRSRGVSQELVVLHCVSLYPTPPKLANLQTIRFLIDKLGGLIGFSDHTIGIDASVLAVGLGARVIEKHFTLDKSYSEFPDHAISMNPTDLKDLVRRVNETKSLLGEYDLKVEENQRKVAKIARRSIVAKNDLVAGTMLEWNHLDWVRPGGGLPPGEEGQLLGKTLKRDIPHGYFIMPADLV